VACLDRQTLPGGIGFSHGGPLVLCPSDVVVEDGVVGQLGLSCQLAGGEAFKCFAFVLAGDTRSTNSIAVRGSICGSVGWVCSVFRMS
jgi:hypothetical protein